MPPGRVSSYPLLRWVKAPTMEGDQATLSRRYLERLPVLVSAGFGETGRGCSSITALLLMQFVFL